MRFLFAILVLAAGCGAAQAQDDDVRCVQQYLADAGYSPGPIDGYYGQNTLEAAEQFRQIEELGDSLPEFSRNTADEWCSTLDEPVEIADGTYRARLGSGDCMDLTLADGEPDAFQIMRGGCSADAQQINDLSVSGDTLHLGDADFQVESNDGRGMIQGEWTFGGWSGPVTFLKRD